MWRTTIGILSLTVTLFVGSRAEANDTFAGLNPKLTWINARGGGVISQPLTGFWWWEDQGSGRGPAPARDLYRFTVRRGNKWLLMHRGPDPNIDDTIVPEARHLMGDGEPGVLAQFKFDGECFRGLMRTVEKTRPREEPDCPQYYWWTLTTMCIDDWHRRGTLGASGFQHDENTCELDKGKPMSIGADMERYLGASFAPVQRGRYIGIGAATAPSQYTSTVNLAWDYRPFGAQTGDAAVRVTVDLGPRTDGRKYQLVANGRPSGTYAFASHTPGRYHFVVQAYNRSGEVIHMDQLIADIPGIGGITH